MFFLLCTAHSLNLVGFNGADDSSERTQFFLYMNDLLFFSRSISFWKLLEKYTDKIEINLVKYSKSMKNNVQSLQCDVWESLLTSKIQY